MTRSASLPASTPALGSTTGTLSRAVNRLSSVIGAACIVASSSVGARTLYCSPRGNDDADGSQQAPWQTLAKVNTSVQPGDTVVFSPGIYTGTLSPEVSGTAEAPIRFRSSQPHQAVLAGDEQQRLAIGLNDRRYIHIEDFTVDTDGRGCWMTAVDCDHLTVRGCSMRDARATMQIVKSDQIALIDNIFAKHQVTGNMLSIRECSHVLFEGNSLTMVGHSPLQLTGCTYSVIRSNCFRNNWGRNYEFWASGRILVEDNLVTQARDSGYSADSRAKNLYTDSIYRFNRVFGNLHTPLNSGSYMPMGARPTSYFREPFRLVNSRIYSNVITENLGHGWEFGGINISSNVFFNNILYRNDLTADGVQLTVSDEISRDNRFLNNLISATRRGATTVQRGNAYWTTDEANQNTPVWRDFWSEFAGNIDADPAFADSENQDYRVADGSPCIDAGRPLALAVGSGSGRALPVTDGVPFYDGFGIDGEKGDLIAVGSPRQVARIARIELRYARPALLHLDREVTWEDAMPVSLPWTGDAPDIGAWEAGGSHPGRVLAVARPAAAAPGQRIQFSLDAFGKEVSAATWRFSDGSLMEGQTAARTFETTGQHGVVLRVDFADGDEARSVVFVDVQAPVEPGAPLVDADFEDATRETGWGFHFKFYRSRLTGYEHIAREDGQGKCMRLFADPNKANNVAGIVAPGVWNIDEYPFVRFAYRIPPGTPVGLCVEPFASPNLPRRILLGGTASRSDKDPRVATDTGDVTLIDDNRWHTVTVDVRKVRNAVPELTYLRLFQFHTQWPRDADYEFRFDTFSILAATEP